MSDVRRVMVLDNARQSVVLQRQNINFTLTTTVHARSAEEVALEHTPTGRV